MIQNYTQVSTEEHEMETQLWFRAARLHRGLREDMGRISNAVLVTGQVCNFNIQSMNQYIFTKY